MLRLALAALLLIGMAGLIWTAQKLRGAPSPTSQAMVPMRDGTGLLTHVWLPDRASSDGRYPSVLTRGYRVRGGEEAARFTKAGYAYVSQAARGEEGSEGELDRFFSDPEDGYDTLSWIAGQPWSDGQIAMYGPSYWGATQWLVAPLQHPSLKAIIPQNIDADLWRCVYRCNGALTLAMAASGRAYTSPEQARRFGYDRLYRHLPLIDLDVAVTGRRNKMWREYVGHEVFDEYWQRISLHSKYNLVNIPVLLMSGWYDYYAGSALQNYMDLKSAGHAEDLRVVINPSDHLNRIVGDRDFGQSADKDNIHLAIRWLDMVLKGAEGGLSGEAPIQIFVMGANEWRGEWEWPLARTRFTRFFFHNPGAGPGTLDTRPPRSEAPSVYRYDPLDPVPTLGGNHSFIGTDHPEIIRAGPVDQRPNEQRDDVLVFTSDALESDLEVTGPVEVVLYASSSAPDTDFTAKLIDVHPDGRSFNITEGIIRGRFRKSIWEPPELLVPGEIHTFRIPLHATSNVFKRHHRIKVHVTSSNFPLWDRNPNTGHPQGMDTELVAAVQTIHHSAAHPSHILLPVIAADRQAPEEAR